MWGRGALAKWNQLDLYGNIVLGPLHMIWEGIKSALSRIFKVNNKETDWLETEKERGIRQENENAPGEEVGPLQRDRQGNIMRRFMCASEEHWARDCIKY